jgi:hypothetical protein
MDAGTAHRVKIIERALRVLPATFPFAGLTEREICLATIEALHRTNDIRALTVRGFDLVLLASKHDDYVLGIFDGATDALQRNGLCRCPDTNTCELN